MIRLIAGTAVLGCPLAAAAAALGRSAGAAFSAVIIYRLAASWLPVLPGWLCLRQLQRMDYV